MVNNKYAFYSNPINKAIAAKNNGNDTYPNPEWGYGVLDMLGVFKYIQ